MKLYGTRALTLTLTFAALAVPTIWETSLSSTSAFPADVTQLRQRSDGWVGPVAANGEWMPQFQDADRTAQGVYVQNGRQVEVFTAVYFSQRQGKELGGYGNSVTGTLPSQSSERRFVAGKPFGESKVTDEMYRPWIVWYVYGVGHRWFVDVTRAQLWYGVRSLAGPQLSRAIVLRAPCTPDCGGARSALTSFIEQGGIE